MSTCQPKGGGTAEDLLRDAALLQLPASARMITDWVGLGLLDHPQRRGAGRGHGSNKAHHNTYQRQLFSILLHHRAEGARVSALTAIPLAIWAYWGEEYVPPDQARRALDTWLRAHRKPPKKRAEAAAGALVAQFAHAESTERARKRMYRLLTTAIYNGRIENEEELTATISAAFDPHRRGRNFGPPSARIAPEIVVRTALRREMAIQAVLTGQVDDNMYRQAQAMLQETLVEYLHKQPGLAAQAGELVTMFRAPQTNDLVNDIVGRLLLVLGIQIDEGGQAKPLATENQPR